jgi:glycosyltransferase involved in cell wall biosynthesis
VRLSIIIPAYNEAATIGELLQRVAAQPFEKEILVVDDASRDETARIVKGLALPEVRLLTHERNRGKGAAIRTALAHVSGEVVLIQDADLEYDPADYAKLLAPILGGEADVVYGSRFLAGRHVTSLWHYGVNTFLTRLSNLFTGLRLTDMETCYKAFRREVVTSLELVSNAFEIEPELTAKAARAGARFREVAIAYQGRGYQQGKKIDWRDGVRAIVAIVRFAWFDRR